MLVLKDKHWQITLDETNLLESIEEATLVLDDLHKRITENEDVKLAQKAPHMFKYLKDELQ